MTKHVVILVHGTWGKKSDWHTDPESPLRKSMQESLGCDVCHDDTSRHCCVTFERFLWSGANNVPARLKAGKKFRKYLRAIREEYPDATMHAITHSHGGNVAMYALRDTDSIEQSQLLASLTCLSTPFVHASPRALGEDVGRKLRRSMTILTLLILLMTAIVLFASLPELYRVLFDGAPLIAAATAAVALLVLYPIVHLLFTGIHKWAQRYADKMALPHKLGVQTLIIRGAGDEASAVLDFAQFVSSISTKLIHACVRIAAKQQFFRWCKTVFIGAGLLWLAGLAFPSVLVVFDKNYVGWWGVLLFVPILIWLFATGFAWMSMVVLILSVFPFGGLTLAAFSLYVSVESTPPGFWDVQQLTPRPYSMESGVIVRHPTHSHPEALGKLRRWYQEHFPHLDDARSIA
ncbi:MAG TPA: hypothetical protein VF787_01080 [Thermoanaerobaculia bacterium]